MNVLARNSWIGFALVFPMVAVLLAGAVQAELGPVLLGLADLACAACADPSNGISTAGAAGGAVAGGGAAGGAAAGGGVNGSGDPDPYDDAGDQTPRTTLPYRPPFKPGPLLRFSRLTETWVKSMVGEDRRGTTGPSHGGGMHYDADYVGRDYEENPLEPPAPRGS